MTITGDMQLGDAVSSDFSAIIDQGGSLSGLASVTLFDITFGASLSASVSDGLEFTFDTEEIDATFGGVHVEGSLSLSIDLDTSPDLEIVLGAWEVSYDGLSRSGSGLNVSTSGCFDVGSFPYWCPTWTNPLRTCTHTITVCFD